MADIQQVDIEENQQDSLTLGDRLRELYDPQDFVVVQNVDTKPLTYQFANPADHETFSSYPGHKETTMKNPPTRVTLTPGETKLCPAFEADRMLENLVKQKAIRGTADKIEAGTLRVGSSANWSDPAFQKAILSEAFIGKKDVVGEFNLDAASEVEKDLAKPKNK